MKPQVAKKVLFTLLIVVVIVATLALIINPALTLTVGNFTVTAAPVFMGGSLLFLLGLMVGAMVQED